MLDQKLIRAQPDKVRQALLSRNYDHGLVDEFLRLDEKWRTLLTQVDRLKQKRNEASLEIGKRKKEGQDTTQEQDEVRKINESIKTMDEEVGQAEEKLNELLLTFPNLPHESVPSGKDASSNPVVKSWEKGKCPDGEPKPHWQIAEELQIIDFTRGAKLSGSMFSLYRGAGARLQRSLIQFMLDFHIEKHGYTELYPPYLVKPQIMVGTGQLPKFKIDMYHLEVDDLFLIPTAEVPVTNFHRDEILPGEELPKKYVSYTACFRREAGAAGADTRGLQRLHQFDKVEMVKLTTPESSYDEHEKLLNDAEEILKALELRYRVILLCAGDLGFAAAKCYDLEVWSPSAKKWLEVSSCSNFGDFQARRANLRFRRDPKSKPEFPHTLNASGLALPRVVIAILENYQESDGTILVPKVLHAYMGGLERIGIAKGVSSPVSNWQSN